MTDLEKLIEAIEGEDAEEVKSLIRILTRDAVIDPDQNGWANKAYRGSLDAAKALHEALLPEWSLERLTMWPGSKCHACLWGTHEEGGERWHSFEDGRVDAEAVTPARAWLLAILRAYATRGAA